MNIQDVELAWLSGILEGEGSFMMGRNIVGGKVYFYPRVVVTMTDRDVIDKVASLFETNTYCLPEKSDRKDQYRAQVNGSRAATLMEMLLPHMGERRSSKIKEILLEYGEIEPTNVRRSRACSIAQKQRWAIYGTRSGKL